MRCLRILLNITYRERITKIGPHSKLLAMVITKKLKWFSNVIRSNTMSKTLLQCEVDGKIWRGIPKCNDKI